MSTIKELRAEQAELYGQIKKLGDEFNEKKAWDGEKEQTWEKVNADYDACVAKIDELQNQQSVADRLSLLESQQAAPVNPLNIGLPNAGGGMVGGRPAPGSFELPSEETRALAFNGWLRAQMGKRITQEHQDAANAAGLWLGTSELCFSLPEVNVLNDFRDAWNATPRNQKSGFLRQYNAPLTTGTPSTGGNIIPPETMLRQLEVNMLAYGGMRQVAEQITTSGGEPLSWPTANDTSNEGRQIDESTPADDNAGGGSSGDGGPNPAFGKVTWGAFKYTSDTILVPYELLEDSPFNVPVILGQMIGERIGRITNRRFTTGTGSGQPQGIVGAAGAGVTAAATNAITYDEVINLEHSVDPAYRDGGGYMFHDTTLLLLRKIKDGDGRYLWQSGANTGAPDTLNNRPYVINQHMAHTGSGAASVVMLFGQLSKYKIRRVNQIRMYRLGERYRENDQDGFVAFVREDGGLLDAGTDPVKKLTLAAS